MSHMLDWRGRPEARRSVALSVVVLGTGLLACNDSGTKKRADNQPPIAQLEVTPLVGIAPLTVTLDGTGSVDPDGDVLTFQWDMDGDGNWDSTNETTNVTYETTYEQAGEFLVRLQVTDTKGATHTATATSPVEVQAAGNPVANIDVDTDRDGVVTAADDVNEDVWSADQGAVFMVNADDDDGDGQQDLSDSVVNGANDLLDMASIVVHQSNELSPFHQVTLEVSPAAAADAVRIFTDEATPALIHDLGDQTATVDADALINGDLMLKLEATAGRSPDWDGEVTLTLRIGAAGNVLSEDAVTLRCSPVIFTDNARSVVSVHIMKITRQMAGPNTALFNAVQAHLPQGATLHIADEGEYNTDRWNQDNMQSAYQSMPGDSGARVSRTFLEAERPGSPRNPGLQFYLTEGLLTADLGYVYPCDGNGCQQTSLNFGGNIEVAPPHTGPDGAYPLGRVVVGGGDEGTVFGTRGFNDHAAQVQLDFFDAQEVQGPVLEVSSEWLAVGHVDEFFMFVPDPNNNNGRPWKILISSTTLARQGLRAPYEGGGGSLPVFEGRRAEATVAEVLQDTKLMQFNELAQARIDTVQADLQTALGLTEDDFIEVPTLFEEYRELFMATEMGVAYNPGITNLVVLDGVFLVPDPEGPVYNDNDVWKTQIDAALAPLGMDIVYVDVFESYHELMGEAHCGTNVEGTAYETPWWEL